MSLPSASFARSTSPLSTPASCTVRRPHRCGILPYRAAGSHAVAESVGTPVPQAETLARDVFQKLLQAGHSSRLEALAQKAACFISQNDRVTFDRPPNGLLSKCPSCESHLPACESKLASPVLQFFALPAFATLGLPAVSWRDRGCALHAFQTNRAMPNRCHSSTYHSRAS